MRLNLAHGAVVAATIVGLAGCQSSPGGSGRSWWGAKNKPAANAALANAPAGPQLPSAGASPTGNMPPSYGSLAPGASAASAYPEQQTTYPSTNYPDTHATAAGASAAAYPAYGAQTNASLPATPSTGAMPQNGPYSPAYAQGGASAPVSTAQQTYPAGGADSYTAAAPAGYPTTPANPGAYSPPVDNAGPPGGLRTADASAHSGYGAPADAGYSNNAYAPPAAVPTGNPAYQYPDPSQAVDPAAGAGYGAPANAPASGAGAYGAPAAGAGAYGAPAQANPAAAAGGNPLGDRYPQTNYSQSDQPYAPGNTGYTPPGGAPYQGNAAPTSAPPTTDRRDPNWRPGSTSDYGPSRGARNGSNSGVVAAGYETRTTASGGSSYADRSIPDPNVSGYAAPPAAVAPGYNNSGARATTSQFNPSAVGNGAGAYGTYGAPAVGN
jgi:collagen type III alpha